MALGKCFGERGTGVQEGHSEFAWMGARAPGDKTIAANTMGSGEPIVPQKGDRHYVSCRLCAIPGESSAHDIVEWICPAKGRRGRGVCHWRKADPKRHLLDAELKTGEK